MIALMAIKMKIERGDPETITMGPELNLFRIIRGLFCSHPRHNRPRWAPYQFSNMDSPVVLARKMFDQAVAAVLPGNLIRQNVTFENSILNVANKEQIDFRQFNKKYIIGTHKLDRQHSYFIAKQGFS